MKKRDKKRYFSLIYVPDQEKDPKSYSMSYAKGRLLLIVAAFLAVHTMLGFVGYYQIIRFNRGIRNLKDENKELKARSKRIDDIAKEFLKIRQTDEKIRKAFGGQLGLIQAAGNGGDVQNPQPAQPPGGILPDPKANSGKLNEGYYFLSKNDRGPTVPENLPTLLPVEGFMTTHFQKGDWYIGRSHYGIDIAAQRESVIFAAGAGVVLLADWTPDFGNMIIISHGQGIVSYYGHAAKLLVNQGMSVRKGQAIALLGSSGISSAPHLHFEIWMNGKPLDPEEYLFSVQKGKDNSGPS